MSAVRPFAVGLVVGVVSGTVGLVFGFIGSASALLLVVALGLVTRSYGFLGAGLVGIGLAWFVLVGNTAIACSQTANFCGNANVVPWFVASAVVAITGGVVAAMSVVSQRRSA